MDGPDGEMREDRASVVRLGRHPTGHLLAAVMVAVLLVGCGSRAALAEDLTQSLTETRAAVRAGVLALDLLAHGRATRAVTVTVLDDMVSEAAKAQQRLVTTTGEDEAGRSRRQLASTAVASAVTQLVDAHDALSAGADPQQLHDQLAPVDSVVGAALTAVAR